MEQLIHSPKLIFNFYPKKIFENYDIEKLEYNKLLKTLEYMKQQIYKHMESKFWNEEQDIEIHRWLANNSYLEYRLFECENATDIVELDIFEDTDNTYQNLLVFQTREYMDGIYNKLIIGNDYFGSAFILTDEFEWNLYDGCNILDIPRKEMAIEEIEHIRINKPGEIDFDGMLLAFDDFISLD